MQKTPYDPAVDRSHLSPGVRRLQELAQQFNRTSDYRGIGASLGGPETDVMIVALGAQAAATDVARRQRALASNERS
jgi:hypothetical protein